MHPLDNIPKQYHRQIHEEIIQRPNDEYDTENFKTKVTKLNNEKKESENVY